MNKQKLDQFHYHEMMDRSHFIQFMMEEMLRDHPVAHEYPDIRDKLNEAGEALGEVYSRADSYEEQQDPELDVSKTLEWIAAKKFALLGQTKYVKSRLLRTDREGDIENGKYWKGKLDELRDHHETLEVMQEKLGGKEL